jgi:hypothetical protein
MHQFTKLVLVAGVFAVAGCATKKYEERYEQYHPETWTKVTHCPTQVECACNRKPDKPEQIRVSGKEFTVVERTDLVDTCGNPNSGEDILERERKYYPSWNGSNDPKSKHDEALPLLGIALSGGGARSASTSIGFLGALDASGILGKVDIISSVSGGSYASYWFFSHLYNARNEAGDKNDELSDVRTVADTAGRYSKLFDHYFHYDDCQLVVEEQQNPNCRPRHFPLEPGQEQPKPNDAKGQKELWEKTRFQETVAMHSHLGTRAQQQPFIALEMATETLFWLASVPVHWLEAGLFDRKQNRNPLTFFYHSGIERAYGLYPVAGSDSISQQSFNNAESLGTLVTEGIKGREIDNHPLPWAVPRYGAADPLMRDLPEFMQSQKENQRPLPFWVVNATAAYGGGPKMLRDLTWSGFSHDLRDTVYEFTPIHYGSPRLGYCSYPGQIYQFRDCNSVSRENWLKYSRIVGASGAAIDGLSAGINVSLDVLNAAIGRYIENPRVDDSVRQNHSLLPFPFYALHRARHDEAAPSIYLSDGGQSENLGLYALIRRRVKNIIVLDAEQENKSYDDNFQPSRGAIFEALQRIRCRLYAEHGLRLSIERYGEHKDEEKRQFFKIAESDQSTREAKPCEGSSMKEINFDFQKEEFPYLRGHVCLDKKENCDEKHRLNILYVKLAIDSSQVHVKKNDGGDWEAPCTEGGRYECAVQFYFHDHAKIFPHDSTFDINYSPEQYTAYRDLGFDLGKCIKFEGNGLSLNKYVPGCQGVSSLSGDQK